MSDDVFEDLEAENAETRRKAVRSSESLPPEPRRQAWVHGLGDTDWRVRREAIDTVVANATDDPTMIHELVDAVMQGDNVGLRNAALEALSRLGALAIDALRTRLNMSIGGERKFLIEALGDSGAPQAVPDLVSLCDDPDANVAAAAVDALARIGGPEAEEALRKRLESDDPFQRMAALDGLVRIDARLSWTDLEPVLGDRFARRAAIPLLGRTGAIEAVAPLTQSLDASSPHVAARVVVALHELAKTVGLDPIRAQLTEASAAAIRAQLRDGDRATRRAAIVMALVARDAEALSDAVTAASEEALSPMAVEALRSWGEEAAEPMLATASSAIGVARALALELAAELGRGHADPEHFRAALLDALASTSHDVVSAALRGLAWYARPSDAHRLVALAAHDVESIRGSALVAVEALAERTPDEVAKVLDAAALDDLGPALPRLITRLRGGAALDSLRAGLAAEDPALRRACIEALGDLAGEEPIHLITLTLTDEDASVRETAATTLGRMRAGADPLLHALMAEDVAPEVRVALVRALGKADGPDIVPALASRLEDEEAQVVVAALDALEERAPADLATYVRAGLDHADPEVVTRALGAIGALESDEARAVVETLLETHDAWRVRARAARALVTFASAAETLEARLEREDDPSVRDAIREALATVGKD